MNKQMHPQGPLSIQCSSTKMVHFRPLPCHPYQYTIEMPLPSSPLMLHDFCLTLFFFVEIFLFFFASKQIADPFYQHPKIKKCLLFRFSFPISKTKDGSKMTSIPLSCRPTLDPFFSLNLSLVTRFLSLSGIMVQSAMTIMLSPVLYHVVSMQCLGLVYPYTPTTGYFWR